MENEAEKNELLALAEGLTKDAEQPAELFGQPGTFRMATKVTGVLTVLGIAACFSGDDVLVVLGVILAICCGLFLLIVGISDLTLPKAQDRRTSEQAVNAYFKGMQKGRWDTALATLAPVARESSVISPEVTELKSKRKAYTRNSVKELKSYWKPFIRPHGSLNRRFSKLKVTPIDTDGAMHRHRVDMQIDYYPSWVIVGILGGILPLLILVLVLTKKYKTTFDVVTFKHKSQWWVLDGEFCATLMGPGAPGQRIPRARVV